MAKDIWFISDTHFGHDKCWSTFKRNDGSPLRPFTSTAEMDECMITNWNSVVKPTDKIYHLGDVAMTDLGLKKIGLCNGHKRLVRGNHDVRPIKQYLQYFEEIYGIRILENVAFTHVPIATDCINRRWLGNAHGHLHANMMTCGDEYGNEIVDARYLNVSVEHTNYTPVHLDEVLAKFKRSQK